MTQRVLDALKRLSNATDETQKQKIMADELSKAASEASKKVGGSVTNESVLGKTSEYIKSLGSMGGATISFDKNILDLTDDVLKFGKAMVSLDFGKILLSFKDLAKPIIALDTALRNQVNRNLGLTGGLARDLRADIIEVAEETTKYGIEIGYVADTYSTFINDLGLAVPISREVGEGLMLQARAVGLTASQAGSFLATLTNFGVGLEKGPETLKEMASTARSMGLSTNKFMEFATTNLKMINTLGFSKGIRGFTQIAAKASSIGYDLASAQSAAEKLFDIDGAVEMAAQLNVLGGDFGKLGNAIDLMFSPTNDMEGFTNSLMDATKQFVSFNAEKNTFDVSPLDLRRAREFAKVTGMSIEEVIRSGKRLAKMEMIKDKISFLPDLSEEERTLIGNLGSISDSGEVTLKGKLVSKMESAELTNTLRSLKQEDKKKAMTEKEILNEQLNLFTKSNYYLKAIALQVTGAGDGGGAFTAVGDDLNDLVYDMIKDDTKREAMLDSFMTMFAKNDIRGIEASLEANAKTNDQKIAVQGIKDKMQSYMDEYQKVMGVSAKNSGISGVGSSLKDSVEVKLSPTTNVNVTIDSQLENFTNGERKILKNYAAKVIVDNQGDSVR
jgi:hypothetical protein